MVAEALTFRGQHDRAQSEQVRQSVQQDLSRIHDAAERIRRMTQLYRDRMDGKRVRQP